MFLLVWVCQNLLDVKRKGPGPLSAGGRERARGASKEERSEAVTLTVTGGDDKDVKMHAWATVLT